MRCLVPVFTLLLLVMVPQVQAQGHAFAPTPAQIRHVMSTTVEVSDHREHFHALGRPLTISDGRGGGTLTAVVGGRYPTADAYGQAVFFWHNSRFVGWDSPYEKTAIMRVWSAGAGEISIQYARYNSRDPLCCPTRKPLVVQSGWSGTMFISNGVPPRGLGPTVKITRAR